MKKLLLSALAVVGFASFAQAETVTEDFKTADKWFGTILKGDCVAEAKTATSTVTGIAYTYTFSYASAGNGVIMQGTDNTPENAANSYLSFPLSITCAEITLTTGASASTSAVVNVYAGSTLISENLALNAKGTPFKVTVPAECQAAGTVYKIENVSKKNAQFQSIACSSEVSPVDPVDPVDPVEPTTVKFTKATTVENGTYVFVVNQEGTLKLARPNIEGKGYGRMNLIDATLEGEDVVTEEANAFELVVADGKVTIKHENNYYAMDDSHMTSFQFYAELNEGCYWTSEFVGETVKFTNALNTDCFISQTKGNSGTWYTNVAPAKAPTEYNLPILYKKAGDAAVATIEADDVNAPVVYYNLQGQRVANPENGLYIRVQGNKVEKIAIR